ncbi:hypothetical protein G9F71_022485 [Clostridium sp. FP2]|uniref:hypothetical protein n=1 Tax=Clostridium sp. FP2 TaxID=2724481 RepID=UPI0013E94F86|nr:hypothetical protein [Clostridium sp. FP2]MBZ9625600.1 hypothetical protein [Clostridium sp. FP2]
MAKRKRIIGIAKAIKKGVGSGRGYNYIPWIKIQDVPSKGRSNMIKAIKTGRFKSYGF